MKKQTSTCIMVHLLTATIALAAAPSSTVDYSGPLQLTRNLGMPGVTKPQVLENLKTLEKRHLQQLATVDQSIRNTLQETQTIQIRGADKFNSERVLKSIPDRLALLRDQRQELLRRREFISQLISQVDSKWTTQPLGTFFEQVLIEMALTDLTTAAESKDTNAELWRFYVYLSVAVREVPEPRDDLVAFIGDYLDFSSIKEPKSPVTYIDTRNYTNGAVSQAAHPVRREEAGLLVEKRLQELGLAEKSKKRPVVSPESKSADIELRLRPPRSNE